jgi:hypothetical protein
LQTSIHQAGGAAAAAAAGLLVEYKRLYDSGDMARMARLPRKELLPRDEGLINIQAAEMVRDVAGSTTTRQYSSTLFGSTAAGRRDGA